MIWETAFLYSVLRPQYGPAVTSSRRAEVDRRRESHFMTIPAIGKIYPNRCKRALYEAYGDVAHKSTDDHSHIGASVD